MSYRWAFTILLLGILLIGAVNTGEAAWPDDAYVAGSVMDEHGSPLEGATVTAENSTTGETFQAVTDQDGAYNLTLPLGTYNITAALINHTANTSYLEILVEENVTGLDFTMSELLGAVDGFVTNGEMPVFDARIHLENEFFNYSTNSTNPLGRFHFDGVQPGMYVAFAEKDGYWTKYHDSPVSVTRGETTEISFTMEEQPASIYGQVTFGSKGLSGVQVEVAGEGVTASTTTDANGNYSLSAIPAGTYTVTFTKEDFVGQQFHVSLEPFESEKLDVALEKQTSEGGFIPGFDLPHSLMIVGLILALVTLVLALFIRFRVAKRPELLEKEEVEEEVE